MALRPHRPLGAIVRSLARLAAPVAVARLGIMGMGIVDTVVVGRLAPAELPSFALGWAPTGVLLVTGIGLLMGVQVLAARAVGEGRPADAGVVWRRGLVIAALFGLASAAGLAVGVEPVLVAFGIEPGLAKASAAVSAVLGLSVGMHFAYVCCAFFAEAIQRPLPGTVVIWIANVLNLVLNLVLVPGMGARGSAWATVGSRLLMFAALAAWILASRAGRTHDVRGHAATEARTPGYRSLLRVGTAAAVSQFAEAGAFSTLTLIAGRIGPESAAAYQLLLNSLAVVFMVSLGTSAATAVLVAEAWGRRDTHEATRVGWAGLGLNSVAMVVFTALMLAAAWPIARALTTDAALVAVVASLMPLAAAMLLPDGGQVVVASALRARGDNWLPTASHVFSYVVVMPPLAWWLAEHHGRGVAGLMEAILVASVVSVGVLMARLKLLPH